MAGILKKIFIVFILALAVFAVTVFFKFISGEDGWICSNGEWVRHGHPAAPQPKIPCFD